MQRLEHKHPRPIRWMHWFNVPLLFGMIWSGLLIYWANDVFRIGLGDWTLFHLFPDWFYETFQLDHRLSEGMAWHFAIMWLLAINGFCYVVYTFVSGEWRHLVPNRRSFREAWMVVLHDLHLSKAEPPKRKFNGAQQFAYTGVILDGRRLTRHGPGNLQTDAVSVAHEFAGRVCLGALDTFLVDDGLRGVLLHPHFSGHSGGLEQLSCDGHRLRGHFVERGISWISRSSSRVRWSSRLSCQLRQRRSPMSKERFAGSLVVALRLEPSPRWRGQPVSDG